MNNDDTQALAVVPLEIAANSAPTATAVDEFTAELDKFTAQEAVVYAESADELRKIHDHATDMYHTTVDRLTTLRSEMAATVKDEHNAALATADKLLESLAQIRPGDITLDSFLAKQPTPANLSYTNRPEILLPRVRHRMAKSKYIFPDPAQVVVAVETLAPKEDAPELVHRILHYLYRMHIPSVGLVASAQCRRLIQAAAIYRTEQRQNPPHALDNTLVTAAQTALATFLTEARAHVSC